MTTARRSHSLLKSSRASSLLDSGAVFAGCAFAHSIPSLTISARRFDWVEQGYLNFGAHILMAHVRLNALGLHADQAGLFRVALELMHFHFGAIVQRHLDQRPMFGVRHANGAFCGGAKPVDRVIVVVRLLPDLVSGMLKRRAKRLEALRL